MKKIFAFVLVLLVAFFAGFYWYESNKLGEVVYTTQTIKEGSDTATTTINVAYPVITSGVPKSARVAINNIISNVVQMHVADTKKDWEAMLKDFPQAQGLNLTIQFDVRSDFTKLPYVNVVLETYDFSGGAHGITVDETFVFDARTGKQITFDDIFHTDAAGKNIYDYLSDLSLTALKLKDPNLETYTFAEDGTKPVADNFKVWTLESEGVHVIFGDYQIGPYVIGRPEVVIPYENLAPLLATDSPIQKLINSSTTQK